MARNKYFILGILLVLLSCVMFFTINLKYYQEIKEKEIVFDEYIEAITLPKEKQEKTNKKNIPYLGYIEIPQYKIKNLITKKEIFNTNTVWMIKGSSSLEEKTGNVLLAGHNNPYVFSNLLKIKPGTVIKIVLPKTIQEYKVVKTDTIDSNNFSYFKEENKERKLTLITCVKNNKKRFIVIAKCNICWYNNLSYQKEKMRKREWHARYRKINYFR